MPYLGKSPSQGVRSRYQFTPNAGTTDINSADANGDTLTFTDGNYVDVYLNGVMLKAGTDYTTTTANQVTLSSGTVASDVVDIIVYDTFSLFGGTLEGNVKVNNGTLNVTGAVDFDSTLNVDGNATFVGTINTTGTSKLQFGDTGTYIHQSADGVLDLVSDTEIEINATTVDVNGQLYLIRADGESDNEYIATFKNEEATDDRSYGLLIHAGSTNTDKALVINDHDGSNALFYVHGNGRVGVGTTGADQKMHLYTSSGTTLYKAEVNANSTVGLEIKKTGSTTQTWRIVDGETVNGALQFYDVTDSRVSMQIDGSGNIAIGGSTVTDSNMLNIQGDGSAVNVGTVFNKTNGTAQIWSTQVRNSDNAFLVHNYTASSTPLVISTAGAATFAGGIVQSGGQVTFNSGGTNTVATFTSTDSVAEIQMTDNNGTAGISAEGSTFQVRPSGGAAKLSVAADGQVTIADGDLVIGTSGHGISFAATSDGGVSTPSELLDDYEEGTWTISFPMSTSGSYTARTGYTGAYYTKVGNLVTVFARFETLGESSPSGNIRISGFPFNFINTAPSGGVNAMVFPILFRGYANSGNNMGGFFAPTPNTNYGLLYMQKSDSDYGFEAINETQVANFEGSLNFTYLTE